MKNTLRLKHIKLGLLLALGLFSNLGWGQTNPTAQTLPYNQDFGTATFSSMPAGMASWSGLSGATVSTLAVAEASAPTSNATLSAATASQTSGGTYGFMTSSNARVYIQTSSNGSNGANQIALAINTTGKILITVVYDIEIITANPRTVGVILQYRNGISGSWTSVSGTGNPFSQVAGTTGIKANVSVVLPIEAENLALVHLRWAIWRGTESGNSSGIAIDNISVTSTSTDATLSALTISSGTLAPTFASTTTTYAATVSNATSSLSVTPTRNQANATIEVRVNGGTYTTVTSGSASGNLDLVVGDNTIDLKVTAQDGTTTKTYTTTITRAAAPTSTTWNGTTWSNGTPTASLDAVIDGAYTTTANGVFTAKTLTVNATKSFTINSENSITVAGAVTNNGSFVVQNNANLVQTNTAAVTNTGNIIVNRNSATIQLYDYTLWSSPVSGQLLQGFSPNTLANRFYTYDSTAGTSGLYSVVSAPSTTNFAAANGYLIRAPNTWIAAAPTTFNGVFTGVPNNGTITLSGLTSGKYYAVGNPYPSTISVASFYTANPNAGTLYFWRKTNGASGTAYASRNSAGETSTLGGLTPSADIAVGQGFFVSPTASMDLSFTNAMRATPSTSSVFLRTTEEKSRFWLNLTNTGGLFSQMLVSYMPEATSGIDNAIDGRYINDAPTALTSIINAEEYTIQGRALPFTTTDTLPLGFKTDAAGNYTIAIDHVDGLFSSGQSIYLKDNLLNTLTNLSAGSYTFASAIGTFNSRFEVVFQSTLGVNPPTFSSNSVMAFSENGAIKINTGSDIMTHVEVYDLQGRLLVEKKQINATETKIASSIFNQIVLVQITNSTGAVVTKKIRL